MNFELTKEQQMVREMVKDFAKKEIAPHAEHVDQTGEFPMQTFKKMGELGLMGIPFPEEYGGSGGDTISYALAVEEVGKACGSTGLSYAAAVSLGASPLYYFGTEEQKQTHLTPLASGTALGSFGLTEPNAGSDAGGTQTKAISNGDEYVINGEKCWITNASYARTVIVTAVTGKNKDGKNIISALIVPTDTPGLTITSPYDKMGVRGSNTAEILLEDVRVPAVTYLAIQQKGLNSFYIRWMVVESPSLLLQSALPKQYLTHHWHMRKSESSLDSRFLPFKRFNLSLLTWRWKLIWHGKWC